jgi:hypothetical protein
MKLLSEDWGCDSVLIGWICHIASLGTWVTGCKNYSVTNKMYTYTQNLS